MSAPIVRRDAGDELISVDMPRWPWLSDRSKDMRFLLTSQEAYELARALMQECQDEEIERRATPPVRAGVGA